MTRECGEDASVEGEVRMNLSEGDIPHLLANVDESNLDLKR